MKSFQHSALCFCLFGALSGACAQSRVPGGEARWRPPVAESHDNSEGGASGLPASVASSVDAPPPSPTGAPVPSNSQTAPSGALPQEVVDRAKVSPGNAFAYQGGLYLATATGDAILLRNGPGIDADMALSGSSPDGKLVVFLRGTDPRELWAANTADGQERRLLAETPNDKPERNLTGIGDMQFSPDGRSLFFISLAWATSRAVHVLDFQTLKERFVSDANCWLVIRNGKNRGRLFLKRHRYRVFPGGGYGTYEWCGLVDTNGRELKTLSLDETICPCAEDLSSPERRKIIDSVLGVRETAPVGR